MHQLKPWCKDPRDSHCLRFYITVYSQLLALHVGGDNRLNSLSLSSNQLTGTIPSTFGNLTQLNTLSLSLNQLTGTIPLTLGNLVQMNDLHLNNNPLLAGTIPSTLCSLSGITIRIDCAFIICMCCQDVYDASCRSN